MLAQRNDLWKEKYTALSTVFRIHRKVSVFEWRLKREKKCAHAYDEITKIFFCKFDSTLERMLVEHWFFMKIFNRTEVTSVNDPRSSTPLHGEREIETKTRGLMGTDIRPTNISSCWWWWWWWWREKIKRQTHEGLIYPLLPPPRWTLTDK